MQVVCGTAPLVLDLRLYIRDGVVCLNHQREQGRIRQRFHEDLILATELHIKSNYAWVR